MKTLDEHNAAAHSAWNERMIARAQANGIGCPRCGAELMDSEPNVTLTSSPPQKRVHCCKCAFDGYRVAG